MLKEVIYDYMKNLYSCREIRFSLKTGYPFYLAVRL